MEYKSGKQVQTAPCTLDPQVAASLHNFLSKYPPDTLPQRGDWKALQESSNKFYENLNTILPKHDGIRKERFQCPVSDGNSIDLCWFTPEGERGQSAIVYVHGGGRIAGSIKLYDQIISDYVTRSGVGFLAVEYRMPPIGKDEMLAEDVFSAIMWLKENAGKLGVDEGRIGLMGDSGGGGIAASAAILARDRNVVLSKQILIYPMLDDRNIIPDERLLPFAVWNYDSNYTSWKATMSMEPASDNVSPIISPGRLKDFNGLAPAYILTGFLDIFRDESIAYAQQLAKAGVPIELHVHPAAPHAFDFLARDSDAAQRAINDHIRVICSV